MIFNFKTMVMLELDTCSHKVSVLAKG